MIVASSFSRSLSELALFLSELEVLQICSVQEGLSSFRSPNNDEGGLIFNQLSVWNIGSEGNMKSAN